ncbi:hypothetical protein mRhiFer1_009603 [Rhinolophus ferrumequinum]|uniref:Uncharacterized protein n=1 Tax=Rhinolophus ferrumequinum TaxID=59479 RepID=A0A7J7ZQ42_RHIFE|nr:hypothetical protein mRhiFer1_009603 [Rhinolophus ferrumequinum]
MPAEEMPPRAGKGARRRSGGRSSRRGPVPPAFDSINWAPSFRGRGDSGRGTAGGGTGGNRGPRLPVRAGRRGWGSSTPFGPHVVPPPPHSRWARRGKELDCHLVNARPTHTHTDTHTLSQARGSRAQALGGRALARRSGCAPGWFLGAPPAACLRASH